MGWGDRKRIEAKQLGNAHIRCVSGQAGRYSAFEQIISLGHSIHRRALDLRFRNNPSRQFKRPAPLATCTAWYFCEEFVRSVQGTPFKSMKGRNRISIDDTECGAETTLTVDSYARCNRVLDLRDNAPIQLAYCWAHARRKLFDLTHHNVAPIAKEGLKTDRSPLPDRETNPQDICRGSTGAAPSQKRAQDLRLQNMAGSRPHAGLCKITHRRCAQIHRQIP